MRDDYRKIIIRRIIHQGQADPADKSLNTSPANRWLFYLTLIPAVIVVVVLGAFFFSIVLALFTAVAAAVGVRLWWLRRKLRQTMTAEAERNDEIIEDAEIIEIREDHKKK
jgi:Flp pilus assembly protein TadB